MVIVLINEQQLLKDQVPIRQLIQHCCVVIPDLV
jgi:hypothetical protein